MFPGKIDAFLEFQQERREHDERSNAAVLAKRRHLEEFIAKNKARASTATLAQSKSKQLEKLELIEIAGDEPTANIRAAAGRAAQRARRCAAATWRSAIPSAQIAADIDLEIDHGSRAAIVGDNGQGKTTFLRTVVDSLKPLAGEVRWGHGCQIGIYAQHVYTSLPREADGARVPASTQAASGTKDAGDPRPGRRAAVPRRRTSKKPISVLSGGERARLCLAGLLLSKYNVLVLDEPGNHLDVDTVEALAEALLDYKGTVIFTSHDRHFMKRVATCIVEVRDGRVTNYRGDYEAYLYSVNKEIEDGEREAARRGCRKPPTDVAAREGSAQGREARRPGDPQGKEHAREDDRPAGRAEEGREREAPRDDQRQGSSRPAS